jgi:hypothetical protein
MPFWQKKIVGTHFVLVCMDFFLYLCTLFCVEQQCKMRKWENEKNGKINEQIVND